MLVAADFREKARNALSGNWAVAVGTGFVASLLGVNTALGSSGGGGGSYSGSSGSVGEEELEQIMENEEAAAAIAIVLLIILAIIGVIAMFGMIVGLMKFIIGGPITLGYIKFNFDMLSGKKPEFRDLFSQFHRFGDAFVMQLLRALFIGLWTLLFIVPGVIAAYRYAMAPYILYDNPHMSGHEAIEKSKEMMDGNKWRLFCLNFSFIGWSLLTIFTLGIGMLWLMPYMESSYAAFYQTLKEEKYGILSYETQDVQTQPSSNVYY